MASVNSASLEKISTDRGETSRQVLLTKWRNGLRIEHIAHSRAVVRFGRRGRLLGVPVVVPSALVGTSIVSQPPEEIHPHPAAWEHKPQSRAGRGRHNMILPRYRPNRSVYKPAQDQAENYLSLHEGTAKVYPSGVDAPAR